MLRKLASKEINIATGLTEGLIAPLARYQASVALQKQQNKIPNSDTPFNVNIQDPGYRLVGTYTSKPLTWSVASHPSLCKDGRVGMRGMREGDDPKKMDSPEMKEEESRLLDLLKGGRIGVSRLGSGSHIIPFVVALEKGWMGSQQSSSTLSEKNSAGSSDKTVDLKKPWNSQSLLRYHPRVAGLSTTADGGESSDSDSASSTWSLNVPRSSLVKSQENLSADTPSSSNTNTTDNSNSLNPPFEFIQCQNIDGLTEGIMSEKIDFFLWERFTTKAW
jgi:hypothetical protein